MGRLPICSCGTIKLWHGAANDAETSQHILDWYTPSHVIHGFIFYGLFALLRRATGLALPLGLGLILAIGIEGAWEIAENTPAVIDRLPVHDDRARLHGRQRAELDGRHGFDDRGLLPGLAAAGCPLHRAGRGAELFVGWLIRDNLT